MDQLTVTKVRIKDFKGISDLELSPGQFTSIRGKNGRGKSSLIEALELPFERGPKDNARLVREGAEFAQVEIDFSDGVKVQAVTTAGKTETKVIHPQFGELKKPAAYLKKCLDLASADIQAFIEADPKDQLEIFLRAFPKTLTKEQVEGALGMSIADFERNTGRKVDLETSAITLLPMLSVPLYEDRTVVNREVKSKEAVIADLKATLPPDAEQGETLAAEVAKAEKMLADLEEDKANAIRGAETAAHNDEKTKREQYGAEIRTVEDDRNAEIGRLEKQIQQVKDEAQKRIDEIKQTMNAELVAIVNTKAAAVGAVNESYAPKRAELADQMAKLRARMDAAARAAGTLRSIRSNEEQRDRSKAYSETLTAALNRLDELKSKVMSDLPIEGVEIRDGEIFVNGREFNTQLNTAEKYKLGFKIAALDKQPGQINIVFIDNGESLDSDNKAAIVAAAKELGVSLVMAEVSEDETLQVQTA
jgi:DNA repair exonuclease SbcCD ATPase subunit